MTRVLMLLVALVLFMPAAAVAQETNAPPGNSAIDEYLETVPSASGNTVPRPPAAGGGDSTLTPAQRARLERLGEDGRTLANVVEATSPRKPKEQTPLAGDAGVPDATGRSPLGEVLSVAGGEGGMGVFLPAILLGSLLTAIALVVLRRRSAS